MCGRYSGRNVERIALIIAQVTGEDYETVLARYRRALNGGVRYNIAPTQANVVVAPDDRGQPAATTMKWGPLYRLLDGKPTLLVNARSETIASKPSFRQSMQRRRCLVPADAFFEWKRQGNARTPYLFQMRDQRAFWLAGLYEEAASDLSRSYLLLTTGPNEVMAPIHDRMPVVLDEEKAREWIRPGPLASADVTRLCAPYPADEMTATRVSAVVNNAKNDVPECVAPVSEDDAGPLEFCFD